MERIPFKGKDLCLASYQSPLTDIIQDNGVLLWSIGADCHLRKARFHSAVPLADTLARSHNGLCK